MLKDTWLRKLTSGAPVGAKIGCGDIEGDLEVLVDADVDFVSLDGFGGGTGATDLYVRENVGIPLIAALPRAHKYLDELGMKRNISILAGGGLRSSADFAKCLALGADAVTIGTAALIAINCEQYRVCYSGTCQPISYHQMRMRLDPFLKEQNCPLKILDLNWNTSLRQQGLKNLKTWIEIHCKVPVQHP